MRIQYLIVLLSIMMGNAAFSQATERNSNYNSKYDSSVFSTHHKSDTATLPVYAVGISPSAFLNIFPMVQLSQELRLTPEVGIFVEYALSSERTHKDNRYGRRIKFGTSWVIDRNKLSFSTLNLNYLYRSTTGSFEGPNFIGGGTSTVRNYVNMRAIEGSLSFHKYITNYFKVEFGVGLGVGKVGLLNLQNVSKPETVRDSYLGIPGEVDLEMVNSNENSSLIITNSIHLNVAYVLFDK